MTIVEITGWAGETSEKVLALCKRRSNESSDYLAGRARIVQKDLRGVNNTECKYFNGKHIALQNIQLQDLTHDHNQRTLRQ